jgi:hypothetical protein
MPRAREEIADWRALVESLEHVAPFVPAFG